MEPCSKCGRETSLYNAERPVCPECDDAQADAMLTKLDRRSEYRKVSTTECLKQ
jgi:hypothetical protein